MKRSKTVVRDHVRMGLEDDPYMGKGELAPSNADQVRETRRIHEELSLTIVAPSDVRRMVGTKGADRAAF